MVRAAEHAAQAPAAEPVEAVRHAGPASALLALQRTAGNRAVVRLLSRQTAPEEAVPDRPRAHQRSGAAAGAVARATQLTADADAAPGRDPARLPVQGVRAASPGQQDPLDLSMSGPTC